ncbi:F-box/LRR-repeat protein 12 [Ixodes scapularis]|uniref:F-box/LRR-repeat protein 12 n=1 Tax=Ixodes scapularis TaxID=6945 RepID=UPI001A9D7EA3|nr:F-box/LRR-repeat protein 12 [Ixodes scapularis]
MGNVFICGGDSLKDIALTHFSTLRFSKRKFTTTIEHLPDYVLLNIFNYLDFLELCVIGLVCRKWYALSRDRTLHRRVDLSHVELTPKQLKLLLQMRAMPPAVEELRVFGDHHCLWACSVSPRALGRIQRRCPRLRRLHIHNFSFRSSSRDKCVRLTDFPDTLEHLSLRGSIVGRSSFFKASRQGQCLSKLQILDLGRCFFVADAEAKPWPWLPNLSELYLEGCPFLDSAGYFQDMLRKLSRLTLLDVEGTYVAENALETVASYCPTLEHLFVGCTATKDSSVAAMGNSGGMSRLRSVCLVQTQVTDAGLLQLVRVAPELKVVMLETDQGVSDEGIAEFCDRLPGVAVEIRECIGLVSAVFRHEGCGHYELRFVDAEGS